MTTECGCGRGDYDSEIYSSCYHCYLERRSEFLTCVWCGKWHSPKFATCYSCRQVEGREEAGKDLRLVILGRDRFTCQACGDTEGLLQIDHVKPCAQGGTADPWNLQVLCHLCNRSKGATWWDGGWVSKRRQEIVHAYYTYLWEYLTPDEKERLHREVKLWLIGGIIVGEERPSRRITEDERGYLRWVLEGADWYAADRAAPVTWGRLPGVDSRPRFSAAAGAAAGAAAAVFKPEWPDPDGHCRVCDGWSWLSDEFGPVHRCCRRAEGDGLAWCPACAR